MMVWLASSDKGKQAKTPTPEGWDGINLYNRGYQELTTKEHEATTRLSMIQLKCNLYHVTQENSVSDAEDNEGQIFFIKKKLALLSSGPSRQNHEKRDDDQAVQGSLTFFNLGSCFILLLAMVKCLLFFCQCLIYFCLFQAALK